jgi:hypothetical protein
MSFLSVSKEEKLVALNAAKKDLLIHLYRKITLLGHDPDTYDINDFSFDPTSSGEVDEKFIEKRDVQNTLDKLEAVNSKISELS